MILPVMFQSFQYPVNFISGSPTNKKGPVTFLVGFSLMYHSVVLENIQVPGFGVTEQYPKISCFQVYKLRSIQKKL